MRTWSLHRQEHSQSQSHLPIAPIICAALQKSTTSSSQLSAVCPLPSGNGKTMAAELPEAGRVALCVAVGCAGILDRLLSFLEGAPARGPVLDAAVLFVVLFVTLTLPMAFLAGVILLNTQVTAAATTPVVLAALRQYVLLVCALLVLLFTAFHFLAAGGW